MVAANASPRSAGCVGPDDLSAFYFGKLAPDALQAVAEHLDHCSDCQSSLQALEGKDDPLVAGLRQPLAADPFQQEWQCQQVVKAVQALGTHGQPLDNRPGPGPGDPRKNRAAGLAWGQVGQYQLLGKLGQGGMGTVYRAFHPRLKRVVALKVLSAWRMHDPVAIARFRREIEAVGKLNHPNIVRATDAGEVDGTLFLVMEFVEGINLSCLVNGHGALGVADACALVRQAAIGLQHAHEHGLVHRDIKPSNLLLTPSGEVKVLDLGLALLHEEHPLTEDLTATGQVMGTFDYMAPEQGDDTHAVDIRADIYSLGCTLYHFLTGHAPFGGPQYRGFRSKMRAHAQVPVPPILEPPLPPGLAAVLERLLAKDAAARFVTPAEVAEALLPFTAGSDLGGLLVKGYAYVGPDPGAASAASQSMVGTDEHAASALARTDPSRQRPPNERTAPLEPKPAEQGPAAAAAAPKKASRRLALVAAAGLLIVAGTMMLAGKIIGEKTTSEAKDPVAANAGGPGGDADGAADEEPAEEKPADGKAVYPTALFTFEERGAGARDLGAKVSDILFARLGAKPDLYLVDRDDFKKTLAEAELNLSGAVKKGEATKVGQLTGAKILVMGSVVHVDKKIYLVAKIIGTETSRTVSASVDGKASDELAPLAEKLADKVAEAIAGQADKLVAKAVPVADRLARLRKRLGAGKRPAVLVQVGERHVGLPTFDPAAQTELTHFCKEAGFGVIDPEEGLKSKADVLITGEGLSEFAVRHGNLVTVRARVEVKAVDRKTGRVLAADRQTAVVVDLGEQLAGKAALQEAAAILAERLLPRLVQK